MSELVQIVSVRGLKANREGITYVGRKTKAWKASVLGNPFVLGKAGDRAEVIEKYRQWLWQEIKRGGEVKNELVRLAMLVKEGKEVVLGCWCKPESCHADVLKRCLLWMCSIDQENLSKGVLPCARKS